MTPAHPRPSQPAFHIVDLFAGPGGLDVAADALGVPITGIEWDANACETRRRAGLRTVQGDVRHYNAADFPQANVLTGGPPCQTFTVAGHGAGRRALDDVLEFVDRLVARDDPSKIDIALAKLEDERTGLVLEPLRWALEALDIPGLDPYEAIVLEQVPAVLPVWEAFEVALKAAGYGTTSGILQTEEFGVPQTRRRAVLIARLNVPDDEVNLPEPTHKPYRKETNRAGDPQLDLAVQEQELEQWMSMQAALPQRTAPFVVISNYGTGGDPRARGKRKSSEPSATVTGKISRNRVVTPDGVELPRFDFSEAGRLQSFPAAYPWSGKDIAQQIGNAVPPRLGMHVLSAALDLGKPSKATLERLASWKPPKSQEAPAQTPTP
ncbi:DNA cytosine methyltransferase [Streptomyces sp. 900116325]